MAHWIIEDKGFGGQDYTCSNCKECWNDLFHNPYTWNVCENCRECIEEGKEEYIEEDYKDCNEKIAFPFQFMNQYLLGEIDLDSALDSTLQEVDKLIHEYLNKYESNK